MLSKKQLERYADVLLWGMRKARTKPFRKGDRILLRFDLAGLKLAEIVHRKLMVRGFNVVNRPSETPVMELDFFKYGDRKQLVFIPAGTREMYHSLNGSIFIMAPESLTHLKNIDSRRIGLTLVARKPFREILFKREEKGLLGWTLGSMPTKELAKKARLSLKSYTSQIIRACYLDKGNPVNEWERIYKAGRTIKRWLNNMKVSYYRMESDRMDLKIFPGRQRKWIGLSGHNIPSFEIFTSPDWRGTEGVYYSNLPSYHTGNYVDGIRLEFKKGSAVKIQAKKGEPFVKKMLGLDKFANKVGEFSLTDRRFSRIDRFMAETLYDENFGGKYGNCHIALGSSYSDAYDGNPARLTKARKKALGFNDSALHWDLVNTEKKRVTAVLKQGRTVTIYENGLFKY
jgi:aminopeptidase